MEILLDTNFILSCINQKIDFISYANMLIQEKIEFLLPEEILEEIQILSKRKGERIKDKQSARIALELVKLSNFKKINLNNQNVDDGIVNYLKNNKNIVLASLDKVLRSRVRNKTLTIFGSKELKIN